MKIDTVKVDDGNGGYIVINKKDFDKGRHKLYGVAEKPKKKKQKTIKKDD